jgi:UDP-N-acetylglucosamine:LPS N-acetylglucosamine transferase
LLDAFNTLIRSPKKRETLAKNLAEFAKDDAAERIADIVIRTAKK